MCREANALKTIGAHKCADIVRRANSMFGGGGPPQDRSEREDVWNTILKHSKERLDDLNQQFFEYPDDLTGLLYDYVLNHCEAIDGW